MRGATSGATFSKSRIKMHNQTETCSLRLFELIKLLRLGCVREMESETSLSFQKLSCPNPCTDYHSFFKTLIVNEMRNYLIF